MRMARKINYACVAVKYNVKLRGAPDGASVNSSPRVRVSENENRFAVVFFLRFFNGIRKPFKAFRRKGPLCKRALARKCNAGKAVDFRYRVALRAENLIKVFLVVFILEFVVSVNVYKRSFFSYVLLNGVVVIDIIVLAAYA